LVSKLPIFLALERWPQEQAKINKKTG